jgi:hypothetical protein
MKILSNSLQGYTNTQSSTIGWKEICCSKSTTAQSQQIPIITLSIASGNPEMYLTTFTDSMIAHQSIGFYGAASGTIGHVKGFRVTTAGVIDIPSGNGACDFVSYAQAWNFVDFPWPGTVTGTRFINFRTGNSNNYSVLNTQMYLSVYSERIDLITLTCV